jgi:transposase
MEACGSAHYWGRELRKLGPEVRLLAAQLIKPYRTKPKNGRNDAGAICEAVSRPQMRFVPIKTVEQQAILTAQRARELWVRERTTVAHQMRGLLLEYGIAIAAGLARLRRELPSVLTTTEEVLPLLARTVVSELQTRVQELAERLTGHDRQIAQLAKQSEAAKRVMAVEGGGPITATAVGAAVGAAKAFSHGRQFAAWLGLVPKQFSSGGKSVLGRITKQGNVYLRTLLIPGARAVLQSTATRAHGKSVWVEARRHRRGDNLAAVALAAKHARIVWAVLARGHDYHVVA